MNKINVITGLLVAALVSGCDYMPRKVFDIETKDGQTLKLACPVVDAGRSELTYMIDGDCVIYK